MNMGNGWLNCLHGTGYRCFKRQTDTRESEILIMGEGFMRERVPTMFRSVIFLWNF